MIGNILSLLKLLFTDKTKLFIVILMLLLAGSGVYIVKLKSDLKDKDLEIVQMTAKMITLQADVDAAKATIAGLQSIDSTKQVETSSLNDLLNQCYTRLSQYESDFLEIEENMEKGKEGPQFDEKEFYDAVTRTQHETGASFINRQFDSLK